jgi:hypothetical protein
MMGVEDSIFGVSIVRHRIRLAFIRCSGRVKVKRALHDHGGIEGVMNNGIHDGKKK